MNYLKRLVQAQKLLSSFPADALLIENPIDLLYLTGLELSTGKLLITEEGYQLFVDGRYYEIAKKNSLCSTHLLEKMPLKKWLLDNSKIKTVAFDSTKTLYCDYLQLKTLISITAVDAPIDGLRMIKDEEEIVSLRAAAKLGSDGFKWISSLLREGISEAELALELEFFWKKRGAQKLAFEPIIAFGANGSMPHYRAGETRLKNDQAVLIDIGVTKKHYHSDMTRVLFFGNPVAKIREIYDIVEEAKARALRICRPGTRIGDLDLAAREYIASNGYGEYFTHSLGHGIGLDVHEMPRIRSHGLYHDKILQPGMAITIEPGIYLPGVGGVRLEDTVVIHENGHENLTEESL